MVRSPEEISAQVNDEAEGEAQILRKVGRRRVCKHPENRCYLVPSEIRFEDELRDWIRGLGCAFIRDKDAWVEWMPKHDPLPNKFLLHVTGDGRPATDALMESVARVMELQRQSSQRLTNIPLTSYIPMHFEACSELALWEEVVVKRNVPRRTVHVDELLQPLRPLVAELRYLHFRLFEARAAPLTNVVSMRRSRTRCTKDLELPYRPLFLQFCLGAASGQPDFTLFKEVHEEGAREDIGARAGETSQPSELKAVFQLPIPGDPTGGIDKNRHGFAKILKCNMKDPRPWHLGIFGERIERVWFVLFTYQETGEVESIKVAPTFPASRFWDRKNLLFEVAKLDLVEAVSHATLQDVVEIRPEPGFKLLVRYVDTVCHKLNIPLAPVRFRRHHDQLEIDFTTAEVIGAGGKSLVLRRASDSSVIKVAEQCSISRELAIHKVVDKTPHIRPMVSFDYFGVVSGAGDGLSWMLLDGYGREMRIMDLNRNYEQFWEHASRAVSGLHHHGVYHRDIKPGNFLMFGEQLQLNDFDVSCFVYEPAEVLMQRVGTPLFTSPLFDEAEGYKYRDDWYSLVLSFLYVRGVYSNGRHVETCLEQALQSEDTPDNMKDCIRWLTSDDAAGGAGRVMPEGNT